MMFQNEIQSKYNFIYFFKNNYLFLLYLLFFISNKNFNFEFIYKFSLI